MGDGIYVITLDYGHMVVPYQFSVIDGDLYGVIVKKKIVRLSETNVLEKIEEKMEEKLRKIKKYKESQQLRKEING